MLIFQIRLALASLRKTPLIMGLVVTMIAVSVGVLMTTFSIYHFMSAVPMADKKDTLFAVQLDTLKEWPHETHLKMVSYKDFQNLKDNELPINQSASFLSRVLVDVLDGSQRPFYVDARVSTSGLFSMFRAPFKYGGGWDKAQERDFQKVVVINHEINDKLFGGRNSVGEKLLIGDATFEVVGVLDKWVMTPRLYDLKNTPFGETEGVFIPFSLVEKLKLTNAGNTQEAQLAESDDPFKAFLNSESVWIPYWVEFASKADADSYRQFLTGYVAEQQAVGRFEPGNDSRLVAIEPWLAFHEVVNETNLLLVGLAAMFLLVCAINVMGMLSAKSFGRFKEFSIYRALGASKALLVKMQLVEVLVLGVICGISAVITSLLGLELVKAKFAHYEQVAHLNMALLLGTIVVSIIVCLLAYLYPVLKASQVQPVRYLK